MGFRLLVWRLVVLIELLAVGIDVLVVTGSASHREQVVDTPPCKLWPYVDQKVRFPRVSESGRLTEVFGRTGKAVPSRKQPYRDTSRDVHDRASLLYIAALTRMMVIHNG